MRFADFPECGPTCRFGDAHIYCVLSLLDDKKPISRHTISKITNIGEGSVRKILNILMEWDVVNIRRSGVTISEKGVDWMNKMPMRLIDVEKSEYVMGACHQGMLVCGVADKISNGMHQRDRGVLAGANGASVFLMKEGKIIMPKNWDIDTRDPEFAEHLRSKGIREGDAIIISGASDDNVAKISVISIALDLL